MVVVLRSSKLCSTLMSLLTFKLSCNELFPQTSILTEQLFNAMLSLIAENSSLFKLGYNTKCYSTAVATILTTFYTK